MLGEFISKEDVTKYKMVHANIENEEQLRDKIKSAVRLGNEFKGKTVISFQTENGPKRTETTIWSSTENYIQIKSGVSIPIKSIIDIDY